MDYSQFYIQEFRKFISLHTTSVNTIKNYISDLRLFFSFIEQKGHTPLAPNSLPTYISSDFISQYESFLSLTNPPATTKRRVSSLKKFVDYCQSVGVSPIYQKTTTQSFPPPSQTPEYASQQFAPSLPYSQYQSPPPPFSPPESLQPQPGFPQSPYSDPYANPQFMPPQPVAFMPPAAPSQFQPQAQPQPQSQTPPQAPPQTQPQFQTAPAFNPPPPPNYFSGETFSPPPAPPVPVSHTPVPNRIETPPSVVNPEPPPVRSYSTPHPLPPQFPEPEPRPVDTSDQSHDRQIVHSLESFLTEKSAPESSDLDENREHRSHHTQSNNEPPIWTYIVVSLISFIICLSITLFVTLILMK